jgi:hypothetical protein
MECYLCGKKITLAKCEENDDKLWKLDEDLVEWITDKFTYSWENRSSEGNSDNRFHFNVKYSENGESTINMCDICLNEEIEISRAQMEDENLEK